MRDGKNRFKIKKSIKSALRKLTSYKLRSYAAELAHTYFDGSARKTERELGVSRSMVDESLVPLGILAIDSAETTVIVGNSYETSDFIVDGIEKWYEQTKLKLDLNNLGFGRRRKGKQK